MPSNSNSTGDPDKDGLERWLNQQLTPLPPPDGTFEAIRHRARRRKLRKLAVTVTAAAAAVAAVVTIPRVMLLHISSPGGGVAIGNNNHTHPAVGSSQQELGTATPAPKTTPSAGASSNAPLPPVPPNFHPYSTTFVGLHTGWVLGQAGTPGHCATAYCTSIARTNDAGLTWHGVPAPVTGAANGGASGVSQIRFLNDEDGWVFGPELWSTHDGGHTWSRLDTGGKQVVALETAGTRAFAVFATCSSVAAASCNSFTLMSTPAIGDTWTPVGPATTGLTGSPQAVSLTLTYTRGFLLAPDGTLYSGLLGSGWQRVGSAPCTAGLHLFNAINAMNLVLVCQSTHTLYQSTDAGATWPTVTTYPASLVPNGAVFSPLDGYELATTTGIYYSAGTGAWRPVAITGAASPDGFSYIGMTTPQQGIALAGPGASPYIWITHDGGQTWQALPINN